MRADSGSTENFFSNWGEKQQGILYWVAVAIPTIALAISVLLGGLAVIYFIFQWLADKAGYCFILTDDMQKTIVTLTGAICVAALALSGVHRQNRSAEDRHKIDANLSLKKDILLQVAESYALQANHLFSFAIPNSTEEDRTALVKDINKSFYKLQAVASTEVIVAMLDANKAWVLASFEARIYLDTVAHPQNVNTIDIFLKIIEITTPFIEKMWKFNILARKEIRTGLEDDDVYFSAMQSKFAELPQSLIDLRRRLE